VIQPWRGTAAQWVSLNPVLASGERGFETDTLKIKYGDGIRAWNSLPYFAPASSPDPSTTLLGNPITATELSKLAGIGSQTVISQLNGKAASGHDHAGVYSPVGHNHTGVYSPVGHDHSGVYSPVGHDHDSAYAVKSIEGDVAGKLDKSGGTMTGALVLSGAPTLDLHPATKLYVDSSISVGPTQYNAKSNVFGSTCELAGDDTGDDAVKNQTLWEAVANAGGGLIFYPKGVYRFSRALQDTGAGGSNTQCQIPLRDRTVPTIVIDCVGEVTPPTTLSEQPAPTGTTHSIIKSTLIGASGTASMIGGKPGEVGALNNVMLNLEKLVFRCPANPTLTAVDLSNQTGNYVVRVLIDDGISGEYLHSEPTTGTSYGIKLPPTNHSSFGKVEGLCVAGFYNGVLLGELTEGTILLSACKRGLVVPFAYHARILSLVGIFGCPEGIVVEGGGGGLLKIGLLDIQHENGFGQAWQDVGLKDIADASNVLHGTATWITVDAGVGNSHNLIKNGGTNFITTELA